MEAGNIRAKLNLGMLYFDRGFSTNGPEAGLNMIREAANAGDFRAQWSLAMFYLNGTGLPKDMTNYLVWTRKAAVQAFRMRSTGLRVLWRLAR